uniref:Glutathione peroxidase 3 n=1 Tax=Sus scrofa TaxID=9823 RepID=A0A8D1PVA9_PIG
MQSQHLGTASHLEKSREYLKFQRGTPPPSPAKTRSTGARGPETRLECRVGAMTPQFWASCLFSLCLVGFAQLIPKEQKMKMDCYKGVTGTIYEYGALTLNGEEYIPFKQYAGKHVLFVNMATY